SFLRGLPCAKSCTGVLVGEGRRLRAIVGAGGGRQYPGVFPSGRSPAVSTRLMQRRAAKESRMSTRRASFATLVVTMTIALAAAPAFAQTPSAAGRIKLASGQVFVVRG